MPPTPSSSSPADTSPVSMIDQPVRVEIPQTEPGAADAPAVKPKPRNTRLVKRVAKRVGGVVVLAAAAAVSWAYGLYAVPAVVGFFLLCGVVDVLRHKPLNYATVDRYFFGNGVLTMLLAPFNLFTDLISLPYRNKGVYRFEDLPQLHRREITELLDAARAADIITQLEEKITDGRSMIFFKWYGKDLPTSVDIPAFHKRYETIRTIGVSVFNKRKSTSWHFGPLRATFRVLYNLRPAPDNIAFIQVGDLVHRWNDDPLFIFDDTLMHQSCNETDAVRYCMFIDIVRPNRVRPLMNVIVMGLQFLLIRINRKFYKRWAMIK